MMIKSQDEIKRESTKKSTLFLLPLKYKNNRKIAVKTAGKPQRMASCNKGERTITKPTPWAKESKFSKNGKAVPSPKITISPTFFRLSQTKSSPSLKRYKLKKPMVTPATIE